MQFFYKNLQFFSTVFLRVFMVFFCFLFLFLCLTPAAFLASISVAATHTHTHSLTLKSAEKTKNYKEEAEAAAEEGSKRGEKKAMQKLSQNFYGDAATRQARRGAEGRGKREANIGGPCRWWRHLPPPAACCLLPAAVAATSFACSLKVATHTNARTESTRLPACQVPVNPLCTSLPPLFPLSLSPLSLALPAVPMNVKNE